MLCCRHQSNLAIKKNILTVILIFTHSEGGCQIIIEEITIKGALTMHTVCIICGGRHICLNTSAATGNLAETALYFCICHLVIGLKTNLATRLLGNLRLLCCSCSRSCFRLPNNTLFLNCIGGLHSTVPIYLVPAPSIFTSPITTSFNTLSISRCFFQTWPNPLSIPKLSND